jgi:hypothetical protein
MRYATVFVMVLLMVIGLKIFPSVVCGQMEPGEVKHEQVMNPPTKEVIVDGIKVIFWVETMMEHHQMMEKMGVPMEGMKMDADSTHEISVSLIDEESKKSITDAKINLKIIRPDGSDQIKRAMWMVGMNHYGADFKMDQKGKYQILTLFKVGEKKYKTGFYYNP